MAHDRPSSHDSFPSEIGGYRIQRILGAGGMATVYAAQQDEPRRTVALKVLRTGGSSPNDPRRFRQEAQILARLRHPCIAQIYDFGIHETEQGPMPYFVMEYIPGARNLMEFIAAHDLSIRDRIKLFVQICDAVNHGHRMRIVHRDLKPANILVDREGRPKVIDFGVARSTGHTIDEDTMVTEVGALVGTVQYMSPEQVEAREQDLDARCDVYALGVLLYKGLTGKMPFELKGRPILEAARIIAAGEWSSPSSHRPELRGDLDTIISKAMARDREHRYTTAGRLGRDLLNYLKQQPITDAAHSRAASPSRRRRRLVGRLLALLLVSGGIAGYVLFQGGDESSLPRNAAPDADRGDAANAVVEATPPQPTGREAAPPYHIRAHSNRSAALAMAADGSTLVSGSVDHSVMAWTRARSKLLFNSDEHERPVIDVAISADGETALALSDQGRLTLHHRNDTRGRAAREWTLANDRPSHIDLSRDGRRIAATSTERLSVIVWGTDDDEPRSVLRGTSGGFTGVMFDPSGSLIAAPSERGDIYIWRLDDHLEGERTHRLQPRDEPPLAMTFVDDATKFATLGRDGALLLWSLQDGAVLERFDVRDGDADQNIVAASFDPGGDALLVVDAARRGRILDVHSGAVLADDLQVLERAGAVCVNLQAGVFVAAELSGDLYVRPFVVAPAATP